jgi:hypothetical protein
VTVPLAQKLRHCERKRSNPALGATGLLRRKGSSQ